MDKRLIATHSLLARDNSIWQQQLLSSRRFADRARQLGMPLGARNGAYSLWKLGLLRADCIRSSRKLRNSKLVEVNSGNGMHTYADTRTPRGKQAGWANRDLLVHIQPQHLELLFHPYRLYVVYHIQRVLELNILPYQVLHMPSRYAPLTKQLIKEFNERSKNPEFVHLFEKWNHISELAIQSEPHTNERIFGSLRLAFGLTEKQVRAKQTTYAKRVYTAFRQIGRDSIQNSHTDLCRDSEIVDDNKQLHIILRLMNQQTRKKLKGDVGAAMLFLAMAESIRRSAETAFDEEWPEEDERGFGTYVISKEEIYGARRLTDAGKDRISIIRRFGVDYASKVRWYVEGDTEFHALSSILTGNSIELINLRGKIAEKGDLGFRDSLRSDIAAKRFSLITLDGDRQDFLRVVRKAAESDEICGKFFVNYPDFEFANFDHAELTTIALGLIHDAQNGALTILQTRQFEDAIHNSNSGADVDKILKRFGVGKGIFWGEALMDYAWSNPKKTDNTDDYRPIIEAIRIAIQANGINWDYQRKEFKVDVGTGQTVKRL